MEPPRSLMFEIWVWHMPDTEKASKICCNGPGCTGKTHVNKNIAT
jgi:hypothetical protein